MKLSAGNLKLIVRTPNWLGDLVMSLPALSMLAQKFPEMSFWSHHRVSGLIPVFFPANRVYTTGRLKHHEYTRLLLLTDSFRSALQGFLSRIPERIGYRTDMRSILLTTGIEAPSDRSHHHSSDYVNLALAAGASDNADIPLPSVKQSGKPHIAYFSGAEYGSAKKWIHYPELALRLSEITGLPSVFYGSSGEGRELIELTEGLQHSEIRTDLTLAELASNLLSAVLSVGNDSGGVHVSAALGIPTVTVFGSTSPVWTAPSGKLTETVKSNRSCSPCFKRTCPDGFPECMTDIPTEDVLTACLELLKKSGVSWLT